MSDPEKTPTPEEYLRKLEGELSRIAGEFGHHETADALQWALPILRASLELPEDRVRVGRIIDNFTRESTESARLPVYNALVRAASMLQAPPGDYAALFARAKEAELEVGRTRIALGAKQGESTEAALGRRLGAPPGARDPLDLSPEYAQKAGEAVARKTWQAPKPRVGPVESPPVPPRKLEDSPYWRAARELLVGPLPDGAAVSLGEIDRLASALRRVNASELGERVQERELPSPLESALVKLLAPHVGEPRAIVLGKDESAEDSLKRLLAELAGLREGMVRVREMAFEIGCASKDKRRKKRKRRVCAKVFRGLLDAIEAAEPQE